MGTEGNHLVVHPLGHATGFPFNVIERIRVRQHAHLPRAFGGPRQNGPQLLDLGRFQRAFLWRTAACCSLSQDYPALCDGIFTKFHSVSLAGVTCRCGSLFEAVTIPNRAFAGEVGHFEILCQFQRIHGASIFAKAAEHAPRSIIGEVRQHFPTGGVVTLPAHYNQVLGAGQRAQIAANTQRFAGLWIVIQPWRAAIALRHHRPPQRQPAKSPSAPCLSTTARSSLALATAPSATTTQPLTRRLSFCEKQHAGSPTAALLAPRCTSLSSPAACARAPSSKPVSLALSTAPTPPTAALSAPALISSPTHASTIR